MAKKKAKRKSRSIVVGHLEKVGSGVFSYFVLSSFDPFDGAPFDPFDKLRASKAQDRQGRLSYENFILLARWCGR